MIDYAKIYEYSKDCKTSLINNMTQSINIDDIVKTVSTTTKQYINEENMNYCYKKIKKNTKYYAKIAKKTANDTGEYIITNTIEGIKQSHIARHGAHRIMNNMTDRALNECSKLITNSQANDSDEYFVVDADTDDDTYDLLGLHEEAELVERASFDSGIDELDEDYEEPQPTYQPEVIEELNDDNDENIMIINGQRIQIRDITEIGTNRPSYGYIRVANIIKRIIPLCVNKKVCYQDKKDMTILCRSTRAVTNWIVDSINDKPIPVTYNDIHFLLGYFDKVTEIFKNIILNMIDEHIEKNLTKITQKMAPYSGSSVITSLMLATVVPNVSLRDIQIIGSMLPHISGLDCYYIPSVYHLLSGFVSGSLSELELTNQINTVLNNIRITRTNKYKDDFILGIERDIDNKKYEFMQKLASMCGISKYTSIPICDGRHAAANDILYICNNHNVNTRYLDMYVRHDGKYIPWPVTILAKFLYYLGKYWVKIVSFINALGATFGKYGTRFAVTFYNYILVKLFVYLHEDITRLINWLKNYNKMKEE